MTNSNAVSAAGLPSAIGTKAEHRRAIRDRLIRFLNRPEGRRAQEKLTAVITAFLATRPGVWLGYRAMLGEVVLPEVDGVQWCYPRVQATPPAIVFFRRASSAPNWSKSSFGVDEPNGDETWSLVDDWAKVRGAFIPGLGFDRSRSRLGRGGGFYDRFLARPEVALQPNFLKIGVGYSVQLEVAHPREEHDVLLDAVITESEWIWDLKRTEGILK